LREDMRWKRPEKWHTNDWVLCHDNARPHTACIMQEFLAKSKWQLFPIHSPGLAPSDFFLIPKMKIKLKGWRFDTVEEIQRKMQMVLNTLAKKHFQDVFQKWQKHWDLYVCSQGDCFKGCGAVRHNSFINIFRELLDTPHMMAIHKLISSELLTKQAVITEKCIICRSYIQCCHWELRDLYQGISSYMPLSKKCATYELSHVLTLAINSFLLNCCDPYQYFR
jgi:hypothetical protein